MHLATEYLGLKLKHPLIAGASPLPDDLDKMRALEDAGIAAITMYSLFEEQITQNMVGSDIVAYENSFSEAASRVPEVDLLERGVDAYLEQLDRVKSAVDIPVIGSLNGTHEGEWVNYAKLIEDAGADALELNLYYLPTDLDVGSYEIEDRCIRIVSAVRKRIDIPLSVKLSSSFTALPHFAKRLADIGVDGLVLFNRLYQPDIDTEKLDILPTLDLSHSTELRLRLRWLALLSGRVSTDLSVTGGVHTGLDLAKSLMAGAKSAQMVSGLLLNGPPQIGLVLDELCQWMERKEYTSLEELRGCLNYQRCPSPEALERVNYQRVLKSHRPINLEDNDR
ncbi:MAG: dihydroorotate dehydrogenase-like protein [Verrucomicrobiota bacterium]